MKLLIKYLQSHLKIIILLIMFSVIFAVVFSLYNVSAEPVLYATVLCVATGLIALVIAFLIFVRKHKVLVGLKKDITVSISELPCHHRIIEEDYRELVRILFAENNRLAAEYAVGRKDMIQYYTMWAHQIKTPISAMCLLLQTAESPVHTELDSELFKIEQYVEMVLCFLRADNISSDLLIRKYELDDIIKQAVRKYAREFIRRKISLDYNDIACEVLTDEKWLVFVLEQLLSNALKYTKEGKISIYMDKDTMKTLIIEDTGIGIQAEDIPRVFERGFTGFNGRADKRSTGIGLYLVKKIMIKLGHTLEIESELGKGTRVRLGLQSAELTFD